MAETVGDVAVRIGADTSGLTRGLNDADGALKSFGSKAGAAVGNVAALAAAAAAAGVAIAGSLAVKGMQAVDALDEMADKAGTSVRSMQALQLALGEAGIDSDQTQSAIKKLNLEIGQAQAGNKKAQEAFDRLGLSVEQLSGMDADQRFAAIADAVEGYGNSADRATALSDIFGAKIGPDLATAMAQGGGAIRQASADIEAMGLAMSDVDAAAVANAMDAFGRAQMVIDGISNQLAVEFAPLLEAISKSFMEAGKEGEGFGGVVSASVQGAIKAVAFLANAIDGIKRIGVAVADSLVYGFALVEETFQKVALGIVKALDLIPGIDLTSNIVALEDRVRISQGVMAEAAANIRKQFETPLAGDQFLKYAEDAKKASREAAQATIDARAAAQGGDVAAASGESPEVAKAREEAEKIAKIKAEAAEKDLQNYIASIAAEQGVANDRRAAIQEGLMTEREIMAAHLEEQRQQILAADALGIGDKESNALLMEQLEADHYAKLWDMDKESAEKRAALEKAAADAKLNDIQAALGSASSLMNSESRKMFEVGKAAAIANSIISTYEGVAKAWGLGPILGPPMAALVAASGFAQVANIRKQQFRGGGGSAASASSNTGAVNAANTPVNPAGNAAQPTQRTNITLIGQNFGREQVIGLLNEALRDGYTLAT